MQRLIDRPRVAFQGELGAYSEEAVEQYWCGAAVPVASRTCINVLQALSAGRVEYGVLPINNTLIGPIVAAQEALAASPHVAVIGEITIAIRHALLALPGATLTGLTSIFSHPAALAQCGNFLQQHPHLVIHESYDTAGAARDIAANGRLEEGAIAGLRAAERYGLMIVAADIQDSATNQTLFAIVARDAHSRERDRC
jgi:prephenate dehydratase